MMTVHSTQVVRPTATSSLVPESDIVRFTA
jgi:hypothetical protein